MLDGLALEEVPRGPQGMKPGVHVLGAPDYLHVLRAILGLRLQKVRLRCGTPARAFRLAARLTEPRLRGLVAVAKPRTLPRGDRPS